MNTRPLAVLMVEDSEDDAFLVARELERGGYQPLIERVQSAQALAAALPHRQWDVVLSDYSMPGFDGLAAFRMVHARHGLDIPFIFVSAAIGEARAVEAMKLGVADYVFKDNLGRLIPAIDRELREAAMRRERRAMVAALEASEANFRTVIRDASHGVVVTRGGSICYCNQTLATMFGYESAASLIGTPHADLIAPDHRPAHAVGLAGGETEQGFQRRGEFLGLRPDGATLWIEERAQHAIWFGQPAVISWVVDVTERRRGEEALRTSEERFRGLVENSIQGIAILQDWRRVFCNRAFARMLGYERPEELIGRDASTWIVPEDRQRRRAHNEALLRGEAEPSLDTFAGLNSAGQKVWVKALSQVVTWEGRRALQVAYVDVTRSHQLEEQLLQTQKLEAIGSLAGGVAHDFNNVLSVILSYTEFLRDSLPPDHVAQADVREILKATQRASGLTRQLLAFSRRQVLQLRLLDVNGVVRDMEKMLRRLIGEDIELVTRLDPNVGRISADLSQIEQIIMNLAVNARDAMPRGGALTIATGVDRLDESHLQENVPATPGPYARLTISDTGMGMEESVRRRIFEPFFTTKELGKGSGLGLSTVYGIVKQMGGNIWVYSEPGLGTTFKVYFPLAAPTEANGDAQSSAPRPDEIAGTETILVVEDEQSVREAVCRNLRRAGYTVIEARDGIEALALSAAHAGPIHLVLTDVVMPKMSGRELANRILGTRPGVRILFMSGYTHDAIGRHGVLDEEVSFIEKPFTARAALAKIHDLLHPA